MNLSKLIHEVWSDKRVQEIGVRKREVEIVIKVLSDHIVKALFEYGKVKIQNLFTLQIRKVKGHRIANPQTRERMKIDDYYKIKIEPSKRVKEGLKNLR